MNFQEELEELRRLSDEKSENVGKLKILVLLQVAANESKLQSIKDFVDKFIKENK